MLFQSTIEAWKATKAWFKSDWEGQEKATNAIRGLCKPITFATTLTMNTLTYHPFCLLLMYLAGFSSSFIQWWILFHMLPGTIISILVYYWKYGSTVFAITPQVVTSYANNLSVAFGIAMTSWAQWLFFYFLEYLVVERFLPTWLIGTVIFPTNVIEQSLKHSLYFMYGMGAMLLVTLPLSLKGYRLNMELLGRKPVLSAKEAFLELAMQTAQAGSMMQFYVPLGAILARHGMPVRFGHLGFVLLDMLFSQRLGNQFAVVHQLLHDVNPLFGMLHAEHHICKGVYPVSSGSGLWESPVIVPLFFFSNCVLLPYGLIQTVYCGINFLVHTMWPWKPMVQWHTMHHVIKADMFSGNIPTNRDIAKSESYKLGSRLNDSLFIRFHWFSDVVALGMMIVGNYIFYQMGWSFIAIWNQRL